MTSAITVRALTKRYGSRAVVHDCSFDVQAGTVTGFLGPNGAGKSTTMRMLTGLVKPSSGSILFNGRERSQLHECGRVVGAVFDQAGFYSGCTVSAHLGIAAKVVGVDRARVREVVDHVGLGEVADRRVTHLSQGMAQRLRLATAVLGDPEILILDEPINGLDAGTIEWFRLFMKREAASGRAVFISSHVLAEMQHTIDRVIVISQGEIKADCVLSELLAETRPLIRVRSSDANALSRALTGAGAEVSSLLEDQSVIEAFGVTNEQVGRIAMAHNVELFEVMVVQKSLEDAYFELIGRDTRAQSGLAR